MSERTRADWDDAYANGSYIPGAEQYPLRWAEKAEAFRKGWEGKRLNVAYGDGQRHRFDLFFPKSGTAQGLVVFVHGGYWLKFDKSFWSHLAAGPLSQDWAVCLPSYDLSPAVSLSEIREQVGAAILKAAGQVKGPVRLAGHSAGGHLVTRMLCEDTPLTQPVLERIAAVVSISGLHDLRPLRHTSMNDSFGLSEKDAVLESAALQTRLGTCPVTVWVGADERPEFLRQSKLLAEAWPGTRYREESGKHHFDVIDGLLDAKSAVTKTLLF